MATPGRVEQVWFPSGAHGDVGGQDSPAALRPGGLIEHPRLSLGSAEKPSATGSPCRVTGGDRFPMDPRCPQHSGMNRRWGRLFVVDDRRPTGPGPRKPTEWLHPSAEGNKPVEDRVTLSTGSQPTSRPTESGDVLESGFGRRGPRA